ncbi:MAG: GNAT family N-acetyltransferase [Proteobacteria bacterium]|nr:GNAT family N-acetyltransferase [Pseudomonadota bacterium]
MQVDVITDPKALDGLRDNWDRLYEADPEAQFFLSWTWLARHLQLYEGTWFLLAARDGAPGTPYAALMPLRLRTRMNIKTGEFFNEINMAGNYAADYTGAICLPELAVAAMQAFGRHLRDMHWTRIHLENLRMSEDRLLAMMGQLPSDTLSAREFLRINKSDNVNNCRCFAAGLPDSFDAYVETVLSSNTRQKLKRFTRKVDAGELRITHADATTIDRDIDTLLTFWRTRWGSRKGDRLQSILRHNRIVLRTAFDSGSLFMPVLWQGDRPLGVLASFVDPVKKAMLFYISGRDEAATSIPVGLILHGHSIRLAIEQGLETYDFLRGDEPYKMAFGVTESRIRCALVATKDGRNLGDRLDPRTLDSVFAEVTRMHEQGELARAENGYRQILGTDPRHARALYGLGQLMSDQGNHQEAQALFATLAEVAPSASKVWFRLGAALQAFGRHDDAAGAFRKSLALNEDFAGARLMLGKSLAAMGRQEQAIDVLEDLRHRLEEAPGNNVLASNTDALLKELRPEPSPDYLVLAPLQRQAAQTSMQAL